MSSPEQPSASDGRIEATVGGLEPDLIALRRDLHAHPELSWEEHRTTTKLLEALRAHGIGAEVGPSGTGVIADVGTDGPLVALRGDIDALRMQDTKEVPYRSTIDGVCHSCGHDLHATAVLGAGIALHRELSQPGAVGRVRLIFQPAEESVPGGATALVAAGVVDDVDTVFALHSDPSRPVGTVGVSPGAITSAADQLTIRLFGTGGHTGRPHQAADLAHIAARVVIDLPMSLGRLSDPRDGLNLTFGSIQVGDAPNVIATEARILGSLRASGRGAWEAAPHHIHRLLAAIVEPLGATWELDHKTGAPPIVNDERAVRQVAEAAAAVLGPDHVHPTEQSAGGEDFSWYGDHARLGYFRLGVWDPAGLQVDLHAGGFDLHERAIGLGARILAGAAVRALDDLASS
jgi:amidohydrolase